MYGMDYVPVEALPLPKGDLGTRMRATPAALAVASMLQEDFKEDFSSFQNSLRRLDAESVEIMLGAIETWFQS
jgi:hypothetical protein